MKYIVDYDPPEGQSSRVPGFPMPHEFATLKEARRYIRQQLGVRRLHPSRRWDPDIYESREDSTLVSTEAYYETPDEGCGSYYILRREAPEKHYDLRLRSQYDVL